jgi:hypothetical protein
MAITRTFVQVLAASAAKTFAIILAQQLGIQIQHKNRADNVFQIGAVSLQREYPLIFVLFIAQLGHQHHIQRNENIPGEGIGAAVANAMERGNDVTRHHQHTGGVAHSTRSLYRLRHRKAVAEAKITQIDADGKGNALPGAIYDLGKP